MRFALLCLALLLSSATAIRAADIAPSVEFSTGFATPLHADMALLETLPFSVVEAEDHGKPGRWRGVPFAELLRLAGAPTGDAVRGPNLAKYILVTAADGYRVVFSLGETSPEFGGNMLTLAWERDGAPLSAEEGPFRIIASGDRKQGRWIRQVVKVELLDAPGVSAPPHAH